MQYLQNKTIVITGASSGIGEKLAHNVAQLGGRPILLARSEKKLQEICVQIQHTTGRQAIYYSLDVSDQQQIKEVFAKIYNEVGFIDVLINNAGFGVFDYLHEANMTDIEGMFDVNVIGLIACTQEVLSSMMEQNKGHIINIASIAGKLATAKSSVYSATKHAVLGFTNSLRMELANTNITVSAVNPGPIETNFFAIADKSGSYVQNVQKYMLSSNEVANKITKLMLTKKRELNLPIWMNWGSTLYHLFPSVADKLMGKILSKK
ncbi:SDR family oxidoreductase [Niallia sp. NCCP-28]|uniref:SDR family NAD(P)-dependent oxidoreductase n=1 Tax=Niallia sp. NCCP-28 TaxID=2934712 RepID=UPI002088B7E7|nr:SDR family oxidoreductase [Niallia sp. NCCP-28]GKU81097.1 oxidoreductase [Niallia sp. NCCP-28]